jgi:general secretion pathway protein G
MWTGLRSNHFALCRGFTLIELVVTLAILGLLAAVAMPMVELTVQRGKEQELRADLREMRTAIDAYHAAQVDGRIVMEANGNGYPPDLKTLVDGVKDMSDSSGKKTLYFLRRIPRDPMSDEPQSVPAHETWGLRSYESPPDNPQSGRDVYDAFSKSDKIGLNGRPYREW